MFDKIFSKNPQIGQTIFLMGIINLGILVFGLHLDYTKLAVIFLTCILTDMIFIRVGQGIWRWPYSGINSGFGISFFLRTEILFLYVLAGFLAIASKHLFRVQGRHFLNPSNFGVVVILVFFPILSWTNPIQWSRVYTNIETQFALIGLIFILGCIIVYWVNRVLKKNLFWIIFPFLLIHMTAYFLLANNGSLLTFLTWYTPSFFIFVFFMLTDPQIIPNNRFTLALWAMCIGILPYILQYYINENYTHLIALFLMTLSLPLAHKLDAMPYK